jgi:hypothetical protein
LRDRGLEILATDNYGPHKKYFPYVKDKTPELPLVTADDDVIYPRYWLDLLVQKHRRLPDEIHCYRARRVLLDVNGLRPYADWPLCNSSDASHLNFVTGVSGALYPIAFLDALRGFGNAFVDKCPRADDVWLNLIAARSGHKVMQINPQAAEFEEIPGSQVQALWVTNQLGGENDRQLQLSYTAADIALLRSASGTS